MIEIYNELYSLYGPQHWWPAEMQFEMIIGAILTQNTAWHNVSIAIKNLKDHDLLDLFPLLQADENLIKRLIKPVGFFNVKYERLIYMLEYLAEQGLDNPKFSDAPVEKLRKEFLDIKGVGRETADSILLYAFGRPIFVIDSYTRRLFSRLGYAWMEKADYDKIQGYFMDNLPLDSALYNEYHALIVRHCKDFCRKKPFCSGCALTCPIKAIELKFL